MNKTLFVKIDNTPVPIDAENEVVLLDCKQINDFCSFAGDALVGDLKDNNGTPFYRLINPVGRLLSDFEKVDKANYDQIIAQWLDVLGEMLHKGVAQCDEKFTIHFPQQYVDWLLCNENDYYVEIGRCLQSNGGKVYLDANGISEDIISALHMKIRRFLNDNKDDIEYVVFSNERIGNSSYVVKQLKIVFDSYSFMRLEQWINIINEEIQKRFLTLVDYRAFRIDHLILGVSRIDELDNVGENGLGYYKGCHIWFNGGIWDRLYVTCYAEAFNNFLSIIMGKECKNSECSYNSIVRRLKAIGGDIGIPKWNYSNGSTWFLAECLLETQQFRCVLFFQDSSVSNLSMTLASDSNGTLYSISVSLK